MATNPSNSGSLFRPKPSVLGNLGEFNRVVEVGNSTTYEATGSNEAAGFIVNGTTSQITLTFSNGGAVAGNVFTAGDVYNIGVKKVVTGGASKVYLLR